MNILGKREERLLCKHCNDFRPAALTQLNDSFRKDKLEMYCIEKDRVEMIYAEPHTSVYVFRRTNLNHGSKKRKSGIFMKPTNLP